MHVFFREGGGGGGGRGWNSYFQNHNGILIIS